MNAVSIDSDPLHSGAVVKNGVVQSGDFHADTSWFSTETFYVGLVPGNDGKVIPLEWYGEKLKRENIVACYISGVQGKNGEYKIIQAQPYLYDLYKKLRQYLEKPPVTCDCVKPIYIYEGERDNDGKDSGTSVMLETDWVDRPESDFKYQLEQ